MHRSLKYALRIAVGILLLFILLWLGVFVVSAFQKERISEMATSQINKQVKGTVTIGDVSPDFFRTFPGISIRISDIDIRDSLWDIHQHQFLQAERIYVRFKLLSLLSGKPKISKVIVEEGNIHLYTDECGYCNLSRADDVGFNKGNAGIPEIILKNTRLIIDNEMKNSYHDFIANDLNCRITKKDSALVLGIRIKSLVNSIGFNMEKGSYLKGKKLEGKFRLVYQEGDKIELNQILLQIDQHPFTFNGNIYLHTDTMSYELKIQTKKVNFPKAVSLFTQSLQQKFENVDLANPVDAEATIAGQMSYRFIPDVILHFSVSDSEMKTPFGQLLHCTYSGSFNNRVDSMLPPGDPNSKFIFNDVQAEWSGIPVTASQIDVSNLLDPYIICDIQSVFELVHLNQLTESSTISFSKGVGNMDIKYNGPLNGNDTINPILNGTISLNAAEFTYIPRNLLFKEGHGMIEFKDEDVIIPHLLVTAGNNNLTMNGNVKNLLALLNVNPEQLTMEWNISTPDLNLNDFISYVRPKQEITLKKSASNNKVLRIADNVDRLLADGTARVNLSADKMSYKKFISTDVTASVLLVGNKVIFNDLKLNHARGKISANGSLENGAKSNLLYLNSRIDNVDIPGFFYTFDNFGQDAITHNNMKGQLSADISMSGHLTDKATVVENSIKGTVQFSIQNGELNNFEPVMKIAETAFKKRDFSKIQFAELKNRLKINGPEIYFDRMEIRSNVVVLFVEGIYDFKKGTDMSIQVPVSNLSKEENEIIENTGRAGVNIRLRAKTEADGKLKISWDPFNSAMKKRKAQMEGKK